MSRPFVGKTLAMALLVCVTAMCRAQLNTVPLPADPLEMVTGQSKVIEDGQERAAVFELLERARQNATLQAGGAAPYAIKVSFDAEGKVSGRNGIMGL
jgi:hypothetical protein